MIHERPIVNPEGLYRQKQVAEILQVDRHTIARYEADGLIKFKVRKAGKTKVATGRQILKCWESTYL